MGSKTQIICGLQKCKHIFRIGSENATSVQCESCDGPECWFCQSSCKEAVQKDAHLHSRCPYCHVNSCSSMQLPPHSMLLLLLFVTTPCYYLYRYAVNCRVKAGATERKAYKTEEVKLPARLPRCLYGSPS